MGRKSKYEDLRNLDTMWLLIQLPRGVGYRISHHTTSQYGFCRPFLLVISDHLSALLHSTLRIQVLSILGRFNMHINTIYSYSWELQLNDLDSIKGQFKFMLSLVNPISGWNNNWKYKLWHVKEKLINWKFSIIFIYVFYLKANDTLKIGKIYWLT